MLSTLLSAAAERSDWQRTDERLGDGWFARISSWGDVAVVVKTHGIPFWLAGEFTPHVRTYFSGWIGMFTGGTIWLLTRGRRIGTQSRSREPGTPRDSVGVEFYCGLTDGLIWNELIMFY